MKPLSEPFADLGQHRASLVAREASNSNVLLQSCLAQVGFPTSVHGFVAVHRFEHADELRKHTVAGLVDEAAVMLVYLGIN